jgi:hypothetical protein
MMLTPPIDPAVLIRDANESNEAVEDQFLRARQAADAANRSAQVAEESWVGAQKAAVAHLTVQAERPRRRAPLPRQVILALVTIVLDGVACYFAAQALGGSQDATLVWTGLFLAVLAGGEVALDFYRDRNLRAWRTLVILTGAFVTVLGILRFWFLATIGTGGLVPAIAGALLFTAATAGFLFLGYRFLRAAETPQAWRARRKARKARQAARNAQASADRDARERDRLIDAYLGHVRRRMAKMCGVEQQLALESAVRDHLSGRSTLDEGAAHSAVRQIHGHARRSPAGHLELQVLALEPGSGYAHALPARHHGSRTRRHHRPGFPPGHASHGSARVCLGASGGTSPHTERSECSDPGLLAGTKLAQHPGACSAGATPIPPDQFPESALWTGRPAVPGRTAQRPGGAPATTTAGTRGMGEVHGRRG